MEESTPRTPHTLQTTNLVRAAQRGDRLALESLFERYLPRVRRIVSLRLGWTLDEFSPWEDVVQDALLGIFRNLDRYQPRSEARFRHWLAACVTNTLRMHLRQESSRRRSETLAFFPRADEETLEALLASDFDPAVIAEGEEASERIEAALLRLSESDREVIVLAKLCGLTAKDIALVMGHASPATTRKALSRALARLEKALR